MRCAVCAMWGMNRAATHVIPWSDTGKAHGRCDSCMVGVAAPQDTAARATRMEQMIRAGYQGPARDNDHTF